MQYKDYVAVSKNLHIVAESANSILVQPLSCKVEKQLDYYVTRSKHIERVSNGHDWYDVNHRWWRLMYKHFM